VDFEKKFVQISENESTKVVSLFHQWRKENFDLSQSNIPEYSYTANLEEIKKKNYSLIPSDYIKFVHSDSLIDYKKTMSKIQKDFKEIISTEIKSQEELLKAFKGLGYDLKI
jgi:type I restriction enzyme M protein